MLYSRESSVNCSKEAMLLSERWLNNRPSICKLCEYSVQLQDASPATDMLDIPQTLFRCPERLTRVLTGQQWAMDRRRALVDPKARTRLRLIRRPVRQTLLGF